jgi:hypothetical protein
MLHVDPYFFLIEWSRRVWQSSIDNGDKYTKQPKRNATMMVEKIQECRSRAKKTPLQRGSEARKHCRLPREVGSDTFERVTTGASFLDS